MTVRFLSAFALAAALGTAAFAQDAEAGLAASTPEDGAALAEAPAALELAFDAPVVLDMVALTSAAGSIVTLDVADVPEGEALSVPLPELGPGSYTVVWRAADASGAARSGSISFTIG